MNKILNLTLVTLSLISLNFTSLIQESQAETCTPFPLVGGEGSEVSKTVSQPTISGPLGVTITRNNWNTDWAVPAKKSFKHYLITVGSNDNTSLQLKMYLKYNDQTADEIFNGNAEITPKTPLKVRAQSRQGDRPYQINVFVGGLEQIGRSYTAQVSGCN